MSLIKFVKILGIILLAFAGLGVLGLWLSTGPPKIIKVAIDDQSKWGSFFLTETGYPFLDFTVLSGNRTQVDGVAFVGSHRPMSWFEEQGFVVDSNKTPKSVRIGSVDGAWFLLRDRGVGNTVEVFTLRHPAMELTIFFYLPETGMLSYCKEYPED